MREKDKFYECAINELRRKIDGDARDVVVSLRAFVEATCRDVPSGLPHFWWCGIYLLTNGNPSAGEAQLELAASSSPACSPIPVRPRDGGVCSDCALI